MRTHRLVLVLATAAAALAGPTAYAADGDPGSAAVTATITAGAIGSRTFTTVSPVTLSTVLGTATLSGTLSFTVTEAARTGTAPWSVTAVSSELAKAGGGTIANTQLTSSGRAVTQVAGGGTATASGASGTLNSAQTIFSVASQSTTAVYTGTYAGSSSLSLAVPNATAVGVYTGTITLTLVQ